MKKTNYFKLVLAVGIISFCISYSANANALIYDKNSTPLIKETSENPIPFILTNGWSALGLGIGEQNTSSSVRSMATDSNGNLYVAGGFSKAGGVAANNIAMWDGSSWSPLGLGVDGQVSKIILDDSDNLYAAGSFNNAGGMSANKIAMWNGTSWIDLSAGLNTNFIQELALDNNGNLYALNFFIDAGNNFFHEIIKWDGASWSILVSIAGGAPNYDSFQTVAFDASNNLYVGGKFSSIGAVNANNIAKWDGATWSNLGVGIDGRVEDIIVTPSGILYAVGSINNASGVSVNNIAKWDGNNWFALGSGLNDSGNFVTLDSDGNLYVAGRFDIAGNVFADQVAKWDGNQWFSFSGSLIDDGGNLNGDINTVAVDSKKNIYFGGRFFKIDDVTVQNIAKFNQSDNASFGNNSLEKITSGESNIAAGDFALHETTSGNRNSAFGVESLKENATHSNNSALGYQAGMQNQGDGNIFIGHQAGANETAANNKLFVDNSDTATPLLYGEFDNDLLRINGELDLATHKITNVVDPTSDQDAATKKYVDDAVSGLGSPTGSNTPYGEFTLGAITTGTDNTAVGQNALTNTTSGSQNTAVGINALSTNTTGSLNTALGRDALLNSTTATNNVAVGNRTMKNNTTGNKNAAIGNYAMEANTTAIRNTAIGFMSLRLNKTGNHNTGIGYFSLYNNEAEGSTGIGFGALLTNKTGIRNTGIGYAADVTMNNITNATAIGNNAKVAGTNHIRFGNTLINNIEGQVNFTAVSDRKYKTNIQESTLGLEFIEKLNPVTYHMKEHGDKIYTGFIAQEVEQVTKELEVEFSGLKKPANHTDHYGLRYAEFTVPLVKGMQEQQEIIEDQQARIEELENKLARIEKLLFQEPSSTQNLELTLQGNSKQAELLQNIPNPFISNTLIKAFIPQDVQNARLVITDINGKVLLEEVIAERGSINTTINAMNLAQGNYIYSLILDDKLLASKTMILTK